MNHKVVHRNPNVYRSGPYREPDSDMRRYVFYNEQGINCELFITEEDFRKENFKEFDFHATLLVNQLSQS